MNVKMPKHFAVCSKCGRKFYGFTQGQADYNKGSHELICKGENTEAHKQKAEAVK